MRPNLKARRVNIFAPFRWLAQGYGDLYEAARPAFTYGAVFALIGGGLAWGLYRNGEDAWLPVLWAGFLILAPVLATGIYVAARAQEAGAPARFWDMIFPTTASPTQIIILGLFLLGLFWVWGSMADKLAWIVGREAHSGIDVLIGYIAGSRHGMAMAAMGVIAGGILATLAYLTSAISVPILVDQQVGIFAALKLNFAALIINPLAMLIWAALIAVITIIGLATAFLWFVFAFPWLGFASWRAYRELIGPEFEDASCRAGLQET